MRRRRANKKTHSARDSGQAAANPEYSAGNNVKSTRTACRLAYYVKSDLDLPIAAAVLFLHLATREFEVEEQWDTTAIDIQCNHVSSKIDPSIDV